MPVTATRPDYDPVSLAPLSFWRQTPQEREASFRELRARRPISWHPPAEGSMLPQTEGGGFWAVTRHADIVSISKNTDTFVSGRGVILEAVPQELLDSAQSFLAMDAPRHTQLRRLVSSAFTPRRVKVIEEQIRGQANRLVGELIEAGDCDLVDQLARRLPMWTIFEMVGLSPESRDAATHAADGMVSWADDDVRGDLEPAQLLFQSLMTLHGISKELAASRRASPQDDLMTNLVQAEVDGERLTDEEIGAFFVLLSVAGNDTTRNTISHTAMAFTEFPGERARLLADFPGRIGTAVEEFIRWATPVMTFRRTAARDIELHGQDIREGDWVVMFYSSGNRDESVFSDPGRFDVLRSPNNHVGFGGGGPHFCLGNMLARTQLRAVWDELLHRVPNLEVGEPTYLVGNFMSAVKKLPCTLNR
ncbi:MAG TPA: cytochrome P450 [Pseudonocardia sp.]|nr:cytochrome P450 [Pseudonocardia sp.]